MEEKLIRKIVFLKSSEKKNIDELLNELVSHQGSFMKEQLENHLASLLIYVNKNFDDIDKKTLLELVNNKLKDLNINYDTSEIENIYKRLIFSSAVNSKIVFNKIDIKAIETMRNNFYWVGKEYSDKTQEKLKTVIEDAFRGNITRKDISHKLKKEFEGLIKQDVPYFEAVADHIINQSQNVARVNQALKYNVKHFKVIARIDSKTSDICRCMHGRIIEASHLQNQCTNILNAKNISEKKEASQWKNGYHFGRLESNFGLPPYHFRCRTQVVPVWLKDEELEGKKVRYASKSKDDIISHIDKTGVQRRLTKKNYYTKDGHTSPIYQRTSKKDIISALNSIKQIAPHNKYANRSVAQSASGYFMVFEADELVTIFKPDRKDYFKKYAILDKKEIIKWNRKKENLLSGFIRILSGK